MAIGTEGAAEVAPHHTAVVVMGISSWTLAASAGAALGDSCCGLSETIAHAPACRSTNRQNAARIAKSVPGALR
jgi:hypothetical protein